MTEADLPAVNRIGDQVHVRHWERDAIAGERLALYPAGCHVLAQGAKVAGYVTSHPWRALAPPGLDTLLGALPAAPDTYYIHDIALLPSARRRGAASVIVRELIEHAGAAGLPGMSLIAVSRSAPFWAGHGFRVLDDAVLALKLASYGGEAHYLTRALPG